jgi:hypothetical protein
VARRVGKEAAHLRPETPDPSPDGALDAAGLDEGWLVLFDLRGELSWEERLFYRDENVSGKVVHLVDC